MNARSVTPPPADARLLALLASAERLTAERREEEALRLLREAEASFPGHPLVLQERARRLLMAGDAGAARPLFEQAAAAAPEHLPLWLDLAACLRRLEAREEELRALDRALVIDPTHLIVLLQKAALLDLMNKPRTAAGVYVNALQTLAPGTRLPAAVESHVAHARRRVAENAAGLAALIEARLATVRAPAADVAAAAPPGGHARAPRRRFDRCLERMLGRQRIYTPEPAFMRFPFLNDYEYYDRAYFPWLADLEAATAAIREELLGVLAEDSAGIRPYIDYDEGLPLNQWKELNHSRRWGAYFLWNEGRRIETAMARCPRTVAMLSSLPQVDIPGRGPTAFFSILEARTRIPAHTGVVNTRLTVHLPLIVPGGCRFRGGGETREWRTGSAWVFDDTIEHEAWNDSDAPRAILIFDIWNPQLTPLERDLVREMTLGIMEYNAPEADGPAAAATQGIKGER